MPILQLPGKEVAQWCNDVMNGALEHCNIVLGVSHFQWKRIYCEGVGSGATTTKGQGRSLPYHIYGTAKSGIGAKRPAKKER
jgi:hypothetical protein